MTTEEIIKEHLENNKFDGLCCPDIECGCGMNDLFACSEYFGECEPGYQIKDESGEYDFLITTQKPEK